jgi:apolipoprotein N-acyltransferase
MMHKTPLLMQVADLGGVYLVGAILLGSNVAIAEFLRARLERTRIDRRIVIGGLAAPLLGVVYGLVRVPSVDAKAAAGQAVTVGIVQGNLPLFQRSKGLEVQRRLTETLGDRAHLVLWSESSVPNVFEEGGWNAPPPRGHITRRLDVPVLFGAGSKRKVGGVRREFNTAFLADIDGDVVGTYDKQYLLPFGEFIPFGDTFPWLYEKSPNSGRMRPGDSNKPLELAGHRITVLICYEDILPWYVNRSVREGNPELLVNITVDTWFGKTIEPWEHLALAQFRAVEHRRYLARATNSGVSAIVDPVGRVIVHGGLFTEETLLGEVHLMAPTTVYEVLGDLPWYAAALVVVFMVVVQRSRREA